jgi:hypothetical protein
MLHRGDLGEPEGRQEHGNQSVQAEDTGAPRDDCGDDRRVVEKKAGEVAYVIPSEYRCEK